MLGESTYPETDLVGSVQEGLSKEKLGKLPSDRRQGGERQLLEGAKGSEESMAEVHGEWRDRSQTIHRLWAVKGKHLGTKAVGSH